MYKDVRKGITQANYNESAIGFLAFEEFIITAAAGVITMSWWIFGSSLLAFLVISWIRPLRNVLYFILTLAWGAVGWWLGTLTGSIGASAVFSILALLITGGLHIGASEWMGDLNNEDESIQPKEPNLFAEKLRRWKLQRQRRKAFEKWK